MLLHWSISDHCSSFPRHPLHITLQDQDHISLQVCLTIACVFQLYISIAFSFPHQTATATVVAVEQKKYVLEYMVVVQTRTMHADYDEARKIHIMDIRVLCRVRQNPVGSLSKITICVPMQCAKWSTKLNTQASSPQLVICMRRGNLWKSHGWLWLLVDSSG